MKNKHITTVLFDLDGTLIDTNPLIIKTFQKTLAYFIKDREFSEVEIMDFIGPTLKQTFDGLLPEKTEDMIAYYRDYNKIIHDEMVVIYPTVYEGLELLKDAGIRLGIVSSKKNDMVRHGLKHCKIDHFFEMVIGADDVINPKPDKEPLELAFKQMNVSKDEVIFVGDNYHDIECGKNAGVLTCGVSWSLRGAYYLKQFDPDYILEDMKDLVKIIKEV